MIMGHVGLGGHFDKWIHAFHMPMFFFVSGMFFRSDNQYSAKDFIRKKAKSLLFPYVMLGLLQYIIWQVARYPKIDVTPLRHLFFINTDGLAIAGALWFLTALFAADIIYFTIRKYIHSKFVYNILIFSIAVIGNIENIILPFKLPYSLGAAFVGVGLMHLGWIFFHDEKTKQMLNMTLKRTVVLAGVITILILVNGYVNMRIGEYACIPLFWINAVFATLVGINISRFLEKKFSKSVINEVSYIGRNSIIYVCLNQLIIMGMTRMVSVLEFSKVINKCIILLGTMIVLRILSYVCMNTKLKMIFGK